MRFRINLLASMLGLLGVLSACSADDPISPDSNEQTSDVSLILSMGDDIQTKAAAENYTYATTEELTINNCHVAVFEVDGDNEPTNRIHYQDFSEEGMGGLTAKIIDDMSGYRLSLTNVRTYGKEAKKVRVLVIANSDVDFSSNENDTYAKYQALTLTTSSFSSRNLVKVGLSEVATLTYGQTAEDISVRLNQLSAKIEYQGIFVKDSNGREVLQTGFSLTSIEGLNKKSDILIYDVGVAENKEFSVLNIMEAVPTTFYTYETSLVDKQIILSVKNGNEKAKSFSFKSNLFIKGNRYVIKGYYKPSLEADLEWVVMDMFEKTINIPSFE